ncbi:MAG: family 10 glycosylhydrolase [Sedimentisphaerales bacterium]|nr:family 10 glycosylhydrolase [Sedimentisphaerales bacterium]
MRVQTKRNIVRMAQSALLVMLFCAIGLTCAADCPVPDLSGDCQVDMADFAILVDQWLQSPDYTTEGLLAHWDLNETEGFWAYDSSGYGFTAQLQNSPLWQPDDGIISGAIQLDGLNDYLSVDFVLNPADGPFSAFAWIKGGYNREVILTQLDGVGVGREWLQIDTIDGHLITRLTDGATILKSQTTITDGDWHHVGVVWDGFHRFLYVDGQEVAHDEQPIANLQWCNGGLYIGAGKTRADYTFWDGMIDDVRIYTRALTEDEILGLSTPPETPPNSADFDGSDGINMTDFAILADYWLIGPPGEYRCIWVDSWYWNPSFMNTSEADELIQTCRDNNINTVIVEVRKTGDAAYNSNIEPRIEEWISGGPSFDPLGYLIDIAHDTSDEKPYVEVHAWFVAHRISKLEDLDPMHVLLQHPEYVMLDVNGNEIADNGRYIDPGHPGAVDWNVAVILDCLQNYDIDGINLDYIRYPGSTWGYNPVSVARFNAVYGEIGTPSPSDPDWCDWRRECVTLEVKKIYIKSLMVNPWVVLTTDTINWGCAFNDFEHSAAYVSVFQDWVGWLQAGIIDYNTLMGYVCQSCSYEPCAPISNPERHQGWCNLSLDNDDKRGSILSTGAYLQLNVQDAIDQLLWARSQNAAGLNIYDWYSEVSRNEAGENRADFYRELKNQVFPEWVDPPKPEWKTHPTTGILEGNITDNGVPVDHATVEVVGLPQTQTYTDGSGWYGILDVPPGEHILCVRFQDIDMNIPVVLPHPGDIITVNGDLADLL